MSRGGGGVIAILDQTGMIIVTFRVEIVVLVTLRVSREENGENDNF